MFTETISILTPVYNAKEFLPRYFQCILGQSYENLETIMVDDGSTDGSGELCDEYAQKDKRIKVYHMKHSGIVKARALCAEKATGDFIGYADADDWVEPDLFEYLYNLINKYDADIAQCGYYCHKENKTYIDYCPKEEVVALPPFNKKEWGLYSAALWNKLFKREVFPEYVLNEEFSASEDYVHGILAYKKSKKVVFGSLPKYHYAISDNSISHCKNPDRIKLLSPFVCKEFICNVLHDEPIGIKHAKTMLASNCVWYYWRITHNSLESFDDIKDKLRNTIIDNLFLVLFFPKLSPFDRFIQVPAILLGNKSYTFLRNAYRKLLGRK